MTRALSAAMAVYCTAIIYAGTGGITWHAGHRGTGRQDALALQKAKIQSQ